MSDIKIFENEEEVGGFVYIIDFGDFIKIGSSKNPSRRVKQIAGYLKNYAGFEMSGYTSSKRHLNYRENEKTLHQLFSHYRVNNSELFKIDYFEAVRALDTLDYNEDFEGYINDLNGSFEGMKKAFKSFWAIDENKKHASQSVSDYEEVFEKDNLLNLIEKYKKLYKILSFFYQYIYEDMPFEEFEYLYLNELSEEVRDEYYTKKYIKNYVDM